MGQLDRVMLAGALLCACADSPAAAPKSGLETAVPRARAALRVDEPDPRFDAEGHLKPGSLRLSWLEIPLSFERRPGSTERSAIYEADGLSVKQLRDYVMARAQPEKVDYWPRSEHYHQVRPNHSKLLAPLDITVLAVNPAHKRIRLVVDDLAPSGAPALTTSQAMDVLVKARNHLE